MSTISQLVDEIIQIEKSLIRNDIEKSWVKQSIGTVVTHKDGQKYRKVSETGNSAKDWQLVTKDKTGSNQDTQTSEHKHKPAELAKHAKSTSEENLLAAIKQSADPKLREAAHKEIARREKEEKIQEDKVDGGREIDVESLKKKYKEAFEKDDFDTLQKIGKQLAENAKKVQNKNGVDQSKYADKRFTQNFTEEEKDHLDTYASIKYREINSQMRDGNLSKENQKIVDSILQSMNKNKLKEDVIVYRGVGGHYDKSNKNSFTSTSTDKETAKNFARGQNAEVREIKVPKGTPVAYMGGAERELILPPNWDKQDIKKSEDNELKGGKGDKETIQSLAKKHKVSEDQIKEQIKMGLKVEMEHTTNPKVALEIVMDHLTESCEYYTKLKQMESTLKKEK